MDKEIKNLQVKICQYFKPEDQDEMRACLSEIVCCYEGYGLLRFLEKLDGLLSNIVVYEDMLKTMHKYKKLGLYLQKSNQDVFEFRSDYDGVITFIVIVLLALVAFVVSMLFTH